MPLYATLIDDGSIVASDPGSSYPDIDMALSSVLSSAALIAAEILRAGSGVVAMECEVVDRATGNREVRRLVLDVSATSGAVR